MAARIQVRCRPLHNNEGCEPKRTRWMPRRWHVPCSAAKPVLAMSKVEPVATYRELVRLQQQLSDDVVRYQHEIHALLAVLFPEFTTGFADPTRATALALLQRSPSAPAVAQTDVVTLSQVLHQVAPHP